MKKFLSGVNNDTRMNRHENADKYFHAIMELQGVAELKALAKRLRQFHGNKQKHFAKVTPPNYLWLAKRGGGVSTCINAFADFLYAEKMIEFTGNAKCFEFKLAYIAPDKFFSELSRLDNELANFAGYHRYFKGVSCINIDEWIKHVHEDYFCKFLDYIVSKNDKMTTVFCVHTEDINIVKDIESALSSCMRIESMSLGFPKKEELIELIESKYFKPQDFSLAEDAKSLLADSIEGMIGSKYFNGFITLKQLALDILYDLYSSNISCGEMSADMLYRFGKESAYMKRAKTLIAIKTMGFTTSKEEI